MGSIVALDEFRQAMGKKPSPKRPPRPKVSGAEVWGRDYREAESIVFGLLTVRGLMAHHMGQHDHAFDHLCLESLEAAYQLSLSGPGRLKTVVKPLKEWILDEMTEDNKRDLSWALVILDLIEKSPIKEKR